MAKASDPGHPNPAVTECGIHLLRKAGGLATSRFKSERGAAR